MDNEPFTTIATALQDITEALEAAAPALPAPARGKVEEAAGRIRRNRTHLALWLDARR